MSDPAEDKGVTRTTRTSKIGINFGLAGLSYSAEILREEADRLREEFTATKRDELFHLIEAGPPESPTARRAQAELTYYLTMFQVNSAERGTRQLARASWVLVMATIALVVATAVLAYLTASGHH
jgi:hypothetical protein